MSETKVALAERTKLKKLLYRYMEDYVYKYIHKLAQFDTTLSSGKNCLIDLKTKFYRIPTFRPFCTAIHYKIIRKPKFKNGDRGRILQYDLPVRKRL